MSPVCALLVLVYLACAAAGVEASLHGRRGRLMVVKPLTTALLWGVVGAPHDAFGWLVYAGILFSLVGDVALLLPLPAAFMIGLGSFLVAHGCYIAAFARTAGPALAGPATWIAAAGAGVASVFLLRRLWPGTAGMRAPVAVYAAAISTTVATAFGAWSAGRSWTVALGAALFYVGDASLALDKFYRPIRLAPVLTLGVYWLGQLGIALAARGI